jgi:hypothetical protein
MPGLTKVFENIYIFTYDFFLAIFNLCTPRLKVGGVVPHGSPGAGGKWPEFVPPREGDSRSPCPALNALANHGTSLSFLSRLASLTIGARRTPSWSVN